MKQGNKISQRCPCFKNIDIQYSLVISIKNVYLYIDAFADNLKHTFYLLQALITRTNPELSLLRN